MSGTIGIVIFIVSILLVILIHEAAHFTMAKVFKIKVEEFFLGFGPRLWSTRRGETEYGVKAVPLGGYVKIAGMNPYEEISPEDYPRTYPAKPAWQRALVIFAGPATHFVIAFVLFAAFFAFVGTPTTTPVVAKIDTKINHRDSPAVLAGLRPGDVIVRIDGIDHPTVEQVQTEIQGSKGSPVTLDLKHGGSTRVLRITPVKDRNPNTNYYRIGFSFDTHLVRTGVLGSFTHSGAQLGGTVAATVGSLGRVFGPEGIGRVFDLIFGNAHRTIRDATGTVGVVRVAGDLASQAGFGTLLFLLAGVNVFVGILNLVPLPPFDGGHLAVVAWEKIRGRRVDARKLIPVTMVVVIFLMVWFVSITYLDIFKPIPIGR
jgi:membrane-associated protease RseP (regulator of RpoE activity)